MLVRCQLSAPVTGVVAERRGAEALSYEGKCVRCVYSVVGWGGGGEGG